jgi:TolB-like protein/DNA-binding winged helix-turn-helix (wHTH) protein/Tfp pilus assembly protein PilF
MTTPSDIYEFGDFRLDAVKRLVARRTGAPVPLTPRVFDTLLYLVQHSGGVLDKERLMEAVWPDSIVEENNLSQNISSLRRILGESPGSHRYIVTVPGRGYRFVAEVRAAEEPAETKNGSKSDEPPSALANPRAETLEPGKFEKLQRDPQSTHDAVGRNRWLIVVSTLLLLALGAATLFLWRGRTHDSKLSSVIASPAPKPASEKSIAVLPFANLSADRENAFFAEGVHDDILTALAKVADLRVIARTSVAGYDAGSNRDIREIGRELGVAKILEGSVRRAGGKVRVTAQLIDARTNTHLWAETYDRELTDVFAIQSDIARAIATQFQAKLAPNEKSALNEQPTNDLVAYDLYLRAKALFLFTNYFPKGKENALEASRLLDQAVARDPGFVLAYCQLARTHDVLYFFGNDHTPSRRALADAAIGEAVRLRPESGEVHRALAWHLYYGFLDYDRARAEAALAQRTLPNDPQIFELIGYIDRRQGRWDESTRSFEKALELDPRNASMLRNIAGDYFFLRRYTEAAAIFDRLLALDPRDPMSRINRASLDFAWRANPQPLLETIESLLKEGAIAAADINGWLDVALCERDSATINRALATIPSAGVHIDASHFPRAWFEGVAARTRGDDAAARAAFTAARVEAERTAREEWDYGPPLAVLGMIDAALGHKEEAIREGRRAVELLPAAKDSINGAHMQEFLAIIYAWTGEKDLAIDQIRSTLQSPSSLSYGDLRLHPFWDPLRGDARFEKLVADLAPESVLPLTTRVINFPSGRATPAVSEKSIAVLPFANLSGDPENAYFADGIKDEILTRLSKIAALKVISRTSTQKFKSAPDNVHEIARQLGVANILEGSVQKSGKNVRVTVQLIRAESDTHLWAETYDRKLTDMFQVESEVAQRIATALDSTLSGAEKQALAAKPTANVEAYQAYLRGRYFWNKRTDEGFAKAGEYFQQAIAIDPNYAPAYAGLGDVYQFRAYDVVSRTELYAKARVAAQKAIELDETLAEPHASLGLLALNYDWDWATAEREFRQAITLNSNYATAHHWYAEYLAAMGRLDESLREINRARELDPLSLIINTDTGKLLYYSRRYDDAIGQLRETLKIDPEFSPAHIWLSSACATTGLYREAVAESKKIEEKSWALGWLGYIYGISGQRDEAGKILDELKRLTSERPIDPHVMVSVYLGLGDKDHALAALEKEYEVRSVGLTSLKVNPWYDSLRADPRFTDLLRRMNLATP